MRSLRFATLALILFSSPVAFGFAELVKHGYVQCTTCHVSTNGGQLLLTEYGRSLSNEILSSFGKEGEGNLAWGLSKPPDWLLAGAELRTIQTWVETPREKRGAFFPMQAEVAVGYNSERWAVVASGGIEGDKTQQTRNYISPYHYVLYREPEKYNILLGKKDIPYGLNIPDHMSFIKNDIRFGPGYETYLAEVSFIAGPIEVFADGLFGAPDTTRTEPEKGAALTVNWVGFDTSKIGLSYLDGRDDVSNRKLYGAYGIVNLTHDFLFMFEYDQQIYRIDASPLPEQKGNVLFSRLKYEPVQGGWIFLTRQLSQLNSDSDFSKKEANGIGLQWFPRPHFDLLLEYYKEKDPALFDEFTDRGWFIFHAYL